MYVLFKSVNGGVQTVWWCTYYRLFKSHPAPWCVQLQSPAARGSSQKPRKKLSQLSSYYKVSLALVVYCPLPFHSAALLMDYISQCPVQLHHPGRRGGAAALVSLFNPHRLTALPSQEEGEEWAKECTCSHSAQPATGRKKSRQGNAQESHAPPFPAKYQLHLRFASCKPLHISTLCKPIRLHSSAQCFR